MQISRQLTKGLVRPRITAVEVGSLTRVPIDPMQSLRHFAARHPLIQESVENAEVRLNRESEFSTLSCLIAQLLFDTIYKHSSWKLTTAASQRNCRTHKKRQN